jgi:hypothetical protein
MCNPSLEPGGVSSAADTDAEADCDAEPFNEGANPTLPADRAILGGNWCDNVFELALAEEAADAEMLEAC